MVPHVARLALVTSDSLAIKAETFIPADAIANLIICHPHPLHGGSMYAPLVDSLFRILGDEGYAVCRFNFRGVDGSDGQYGHGIDEVLDLEAAIAHLHQQRPHVDTWAIGWSFGSQVALRCVDPILAGWIAIAPPLREPEAMPAGADPRPKLLLVPQHDQFAPPPVVAAHTQAWENRSFETLATADHFLHGHHAPIASTISNFIHTRRPTSD